VLPVLFSPSNSSTPSQSNPFPPTSGSVGGKKERG